MSSTRRGPSQDEGGGQSHKCEEDGNGARDAAPLKSCQGGGKSDRKRAPSEKKTSESNIRVNQASVARASVGRKPTPKIGGTPERNWLAIPNGAV